MRTGQARGLARNNLNEVAGQVQVLLPYHDREMQTLTVFRSAKERSEGRTGMSVRLKSFEREVPMPGTAEPPWNSSGAVRQMMR